MKIAIESAKNYMSRKPYTIQSAKYFIDLRQERKKDDETKKIQK